MEDRRDIFRPPNAQCGPVTTLGGFNPDPIRFIYEQLADHLEAKIRSGELPPNVPLRAERQLAEQYGVSLGTARHATKLLRQRGLVLTLRSKGTFVLPLDPNATDGADDARSRGESAGEPLADSLARRLP